MSMMQAHGTLVLSNTKPLATTAADGTFALTLHGFDRQGPHLVESWRVVYSGTPAKDFWQQCKDRLVPGAPIAVQIHRVRAVGTARSTEFMAYATHIALAPLAHQSTTKTQPEGTYESV